jgi:hypothetical protein
LEKTMARELPPDILKKWETMLAQGWGRFLLRQMIHIAPPLMGAHIVVYKLVFRDATKGSIARDAWRNSFWFLPLIAMGLAWISWRTMQAAVRQARDPLPHHPPADAGTPVPPRPTAPSPKFSKFWTCAPAARMAGRLALLAGIGLLLCFSISGLADGTFITVPLVLIVFFLWLLPGSLEGGCMLDLHHRQLIRWRGVLFPWWRQRVAFDAIKELKIARGKQPGRSSDTWCHLAAITSDRVVLIKRFDYRPEAVRFAQALAGNIGTGVSSEE